MSLNFDLKKLIILIFINVLVIGLFAEDKVITVKEITVEGLKRTKEDVLFRILEPIGEGMVYTEGLEETIIQKLRETGIFVPDMDVSVNLTDQYAYIHILVRDKWTFIPIPIVSVSKGESWKAGVLTIENNLFGLYKTLGLGFFYGSDGWSLLSFYNDKLFLGSPWEITGSVASGLDEVSDLFPDENPAREYATDRLSLALGLRYPITDTFSAGGDLLYDFSFPREGGSPVGNLNAPGVKSEFLWKNVYYDIPYEKGYSITLSLTGGYNIDDPGFYTSAEGLVDWSFSPWLNHLISLKGRGGWGILPVQKQFRLGGLDGSRVLPMDKIAADEFASIAAVYNIPLWIFKGGTISSKAFYEAGYFKSDLIDRTFYHGPGVGLEFFINNLAIPAVGINFGWNLETGEMQFSAGIGM